MFRGSRKTEESCLSKVMFSMLEEGRSLKMWQTTIERFNVFIEAYKKFKNTGDTRYSSSRKQSKIKLLTICTMKSFASILRHVAMNFKEFRQIKSNQNNAINQHKKTVAQEQNHQNCTFLMKPSECSHMKPFLLTKIPVYFARWTCQMNPYIMSAQNQTLNNAFLECQTRLRCYGRWYKIPQFMFVECHWQTNLRGPSSIEIMQLLLGGSRDIWMHHCPRWKY